MASAPKSNRVGVAYWAAGADVQAHGSLPVPGHLLPAPVPAMRAHGIGVGYRMPHDFPGADVEQQYLPDALRERHYYQPSEQGMEGQIAARLERLGEARGAAREAGGARPMPRGRTREGEAMKASGRVMRQRDDAKRRVSERQKMDAAPG